jgi:hypothetical protein
MFLIRSEHKPEEATEFVKAKTPGLKLFIPKLFCYHIQEKSM